MKWFLSFLLFVAIFRVFFFYSNAPEIKDGENLVFTTTLLSEPKQVGKFQQLSVVLANGARVVIKTSLFPKYHYGQTIGVEGIAKLNSTKAGLARSDLDGTERSEVLIPKSAIVSMFFPKIEARKSDQNALLALLFSIRQSITSLFQNALPQHHASLLLGIVFGIKGEFPSNYYDNLRQAGVLHIIAASGMNVAMVASFLSAMFGKFLKRQHGLALTIIGIFVYALFSGLEPSIVRASIMGTLVFVSQMLGRQRLSWYLLFLTGCTMLLFYPYLLLDVGFQLSFMATAGILGFGSILKRYITRFLPPFISEDVITTIGAQLTTVPLLLLNFGSYSLISVVVNTLVLWEIPLLMTIGGLATIMGFIFRPIGTWILYLSIPLLTYFDIVINSFSKLAGKIVFTEIPLAILIGYYFVLTAIWIVLAKRPAPYVTQGKQESRPT